MLSGKTSVYIDTTKSDDDGEVTNQIQGIDGIGSIGSVTEKTDVLRENQSVSDETETKKRRNLDRSKYGKFIIHFGK